MSEILSDDQGQIRILITGVTGFIGGFLADRALEKGWEIWAGVRPVSDTTRIAQKGIHFLTLDYDDPVLLGQQLGEHAQRHGRWNYVIHNAGITKSFTDSEFLKVNFHQTVHFVEALVHKGLTPDRFLFISSLSAVGPVEEKSLEPLRDNVVPAPDSLYGKSKLLAENYLRNLKDFPWLILRPTGVYGPRDKDYRMVFSMIRRGIDLSIGWKPQRLSFIHVSDLASVCFLALDSGMVRKTWFVSDGDAYSSREFSALVRESLDKRWVMPLRIPLFLVRLVAYILLPISRFTGKPVMVNPDKYRILRQRNWTCDTKGIRTDLGFEPVYNLKEGLRQTICWYQENGWL